MMTWHFQAFQRLPHACQSHNFDVSSANLTDADVEFRSATCVSAELTAVVKAKRPAQYGRKLLAAEWRACEDQLLDLSVYLFKERCTKEAEVNRRQASISFDILTRELEQFPKHIVMNETFLVDGWGGSSAEQWFYATHGVDENYDPDNRVLFAALLESTIDNFIKKVTRLGFNTCARDTAGTWRVTVTWDLPDGADMTIRSTMPIWCLSSQ